MTAPANFVTDRVSSQGISLITGAKKLSIKKARATSVSKLDSSTLAIQHGGERTYEDGLEDKGPGGSADGITYTASAEGFGTKPATGDSFTWGSKDLYCTESQYDDNVGELRGWSASYTSDYMPPPSV